MTAVAHLGSFYSAAPIIVWVEDPVTRDYLTKVWGDPPEISFLIAGNNTAIGPVIAAAQREGITRVFGLVDRDFGYTNLVNWPLPATRVFYLPRHEIENYALHVDAVHGCTLHNRGRSPAEIDTELIRLASLQPAWLACRQVLTRMRQHLQADFPGHPNLAAITTLVEAEQQITSSLWFTQLPARATHWTTAGEVPNALGIALGTFNTALGNGNWTVEFSGKEIFRRLRDYVYQPPRIPGSPDFAKAIGEWQHANNQVPADLIQLRSTLRVKVGLSP